MIYIREKYWGKEKIIYTISVARATEIYYARFYCDYLNSSGFRLVDAATVHQLAGQLVRPEQSVLLQFASIKQQEHELLIERRSTARRRRGGQWLAEREVIPSVRTAVFLCLVRIKVGRLLRTELLLSLLHLATAIAVVIELHLLLASSITAHLLLLRPLLWCSAAISLLLLLSATIAALHLLLSTPIAALLRNDWSERLLLATTVTVVHSDWCLLLLLLSITLASLLLSVASALLLRTTELFLLLAASITAHLLLLRPLLWCSAISALLLLLSTAIPASGSDRSDLMVIVELRSPLAVALVATATRFGRLLSSVPGTGFDYVRRGCWEFGSLDRSPSGISEKGGKINWS